MTSTLISRTVYKLSYLYTPCRNYGKNILRRKAIRVLNVPEDGVRPLRDDTFDESNQLAKVSPEMQQNHLTTEVTKEKKIMVPPYEKLQKNDARFTKTLAMIKNRKRREKSGLILLEGKRLINDAIGVGLKMKTLYFSREEDLAAIKIKDPENVELCKVFYKTLSLWSELETSPGVMGIFRRPSADDLNVLSDPAIPVTVVCDNIRDPGNLGAVIRNAAAAGCENILMLKGCVDPWEIKVLRAGCGGHFRIPFVYDIEWSHIYNYIPKDSKIFIADNSVDIDIGSSTSEFISFEETDENSEDIRYVTFNEHNQPLIVDESYNEPSELEKFEDVNLPCHLYTSIKYPTKNIILYVGGETHGVDPRIVKLACDFGGRKVKIPLENEMDSLNSSFAMTIVLYEIKRQMKEQYILEQ
ncbi:rRNA methyltransferase 3, mitochondrial-like [Stegodyphus dumicola]|uniref:rRNA methyltransferase 3, mitochondrial-like n=1 Tax=Stegodyphus dumicola TaxID=202533 RepID=UPI0015AC2082|nr:rRNA methyltransferase 3, mitochondrial-like [Stegodyphus dumicola]